MTTVTAREAGVLGVRRRRAREDRDATREASLESVRESDEVMKTTAERLVKDSKEKGDMGDRGSR